jgi:hypothetical protein
MSLGRLQIALEVVLYAGILTIWLPEMPATAIYDIAIFLAALAWLTAMALDPHPVRTCLAMIPLAAAVLWPLVQMGLHATVYRWNTENAFWRWMVNFICFFLAYQIAGDRLRLLRFLKMTLYFSFGLAAISTLQMFTSGGNIFWVFPSGYTDYVLGPFVYRNQFAAFIELTLPLPIYFALFSRKNRWAYCGMAAAMLASVIASASRAGAILVLGEAVVIPLIALAARMTGRRRAGSMLAMTAGLTILSGVVVGYGAVWQRFFSPDPYFLRREVLISAVRMLRDRPGIGFGLGTWAESYPQYAIFDPGAVINQAHNDWMQWAVEGGWPFFAFMVCAMGLLVRPAVRSLWGIGVLCVLLHCLVDYPLQERPAFAAFFFAVAGAVASMRIERPGAVQSGPAEDNEAPR